jgi:hypothetical protein
VRFGRELVQEYISSDKNGDYENLILYPTDIEDTDTVLCNSLEIK